MPKRPVPAEETMPGKTPWSILPGESETYYAHFLAYLHQIPPRNLRILGEVRGRDYQTMRNYSKKFKWTRRVRAYDAWEAEQIAETEIEEKKRLRREHLRALEKARLIAEHRMAGILEDPEQLETIPPRDVLAFLKESVTLERLITGESTSRTEVTETVNLEEYTDDELNDLEKLHKKGRGDKCATSRQ